MPPKKKKAPVNPIVVGTVSTRSTRRQSVVNIEIPKSNKFKATKDVSKVFSSEGSSTDNSESTSNYLTEQIKETYNKMINRAMEVQVKTDTPEETSISKVFATSPVKAVIVSKSSSQWCVETETKLKYAIAETIKSPLTKENPPLTATKARFKSNKALLQILEDWTDDESQDDRNEEIESSDFKNVKQFQQIEIKEEQESKSSGSDNSECTLFEMAHKIKEECLRAANKAPDVDGAKCVIKTEFVTDENQIMTGKVEPHLAEGKETDRGRETSFQICEIPQLDNMDVNITENVIEYIVDENEEVIIEEPVEETVAFDDDDYIVECVTEEIISEDNDLLDTTADSTSLAESGPEEGFTTEAIIVTNEKKDKSGDKSDCDEIEKLIEMGDNINVVKEHVVLEETSHSVSTSDSNDAEVRSYFSKEIENDEIVKEEDIPSLEYELIGEGSSSNEEHTNLSSAVDKNLMETETAVEGIHEAENSEESSAEFESNSEGIEAEQGGVNKNKEDSCSKSTTVELEEIFNKSDSSFEEPVYSRKNFRQEEILEIIGQGVESRIFHKSSFEEKMDATEATNEESLEKKVEELHLKDDKEKEEEISNKVDELPESTTMDEATLKEDVKMEVDELEEITAEYSTKDEESPLERPKTRRTRGTDSQSVKVLKNVQEEKLQKLTKPVKVSSKNSLKEKKTAKMKETKSKEPVKDSRNRKKVNVSTTSVGKKAKDKTEKKDGSKKTLKMDNDQSKKYAKSDNTDSEDTEVRRSSRIKSISVLKKKTTGHGLVRSKSEPILNESDISDSNSTQTESEKSTPSASPKVSTRERKSRWTRSSENLSSETQPVMDPVLVKGDNQLPEITSMVVDEKPKLPARDPIVEARLKQFVHLKENMYKTDRMTCKEAKKMTCDCFLTSDEIESNEYGCGEDCLNRLLLIEW